MAGISLTVQIRAEEGAFSRYELTEDGTLRYGGGREAAMRKTTWKGALTDAEITELRRLLDEHHWYDGEFHSTGDHDALPRYQINLDSAEADRKIDARGEQPAIEPVVAFLERAAMRRNQGVFDRLPQPSLEAAAPGASEEVDSEGGGEGTSVGTALPR